MKKILALTLCMLMVLALFSGCAAKKEEAPAAEPAAPAEPAVEEKVEETKVEFPTKNITLIIPQNAGGDTDVVGRQLASMMEAKLGVSIVCQNLPGGNTSIGLQAMLDAEPDGYTVALSATNIALIKATGYGDMDYSYFKSLGGINYDTCLVFSRGNEDRWSNVAELVEWAKANPGALTIGTGTAGGVWHLGTVDFMNSTGIDAVIIPSTGGVGGVATTLLNGDIDIAIISIGAFASYVANGDMVALAAMSEERLPFYPETPTMLELGYDLTCLSCRGLITSPEVPEEVCKILEDTLAECVNSPEFDEFLNNMYSVKMAMSGADYYEFMKSENEVYPELVKTAGLGA